MGSVLPGLASLASLASLIWLLAGAVWSAPALAQPHGAPQQVVKDGLALQLELAQPLQEGAETQFTLQLRDAASDTPIRNVRPVAWVDRAVAGDEKPELACRRKAARLISGDPLQAPALNLNAYYVLALNEDASISVIDPQRGFGGSKLLNLVVLRGVGQDWLLTPAQTLWVSQPQVNEVALVDTRSWKIRQSITVAGQPGQLALHPNGQQVWVLHDTGVAVLAAESGALLANISTGRGRHSLAFSEDGKSAFVSNADDNNVSQINTVLLSKIGDLNIGAQPVAMAWSSKAQLLYVAVADGQIVAFDAAANEAGNEAGKEAARLSTKAGQSTIRFAPDGRYAFILNPGQNRLDILDAATNRIVQTASISAEPYQVTFSERMAYIRSRHSEIVQLVQLDSVGKEGQPLSMASFGNGQKAPARASSQASLADSMVLAPGGVAALLANPADRTIYYYKEGMNAPAGSFRNYGHEPRAVLVLDHSLQERQPGVYQAKSHLPKAGNYQLVFYLASPKLVHCFPLTIQIDPARPRAQRVVLGWHGAAPALHSGHSQTLQFSLHNASNGQSLPGVADLQLLIFRTSDQAQQRVLAAEQEAGVYATTFAPGASGYYYVYFQSASIGLSWNQSTPLVMTVK